MRISQSIVDSMRKDKSNGLSLDYISRTYNVAKSTASLYCRDLYNYSSRVYQTQEEARQMSALHTTKLRRQEFDTKSKNSKPQRIKSHFVIRPDLIAKPCTESPTSKHSCLSGKCIWCGRVV